MEKCDRVEQPHHHLATGSWLLRTLAIHDRINKKFFRVARTVVTRISPTHARTRPETAWRKNQIALGKGDVAAACIEMTQLAINNIKLGGSSVVGEPKGMDRAAITLRDIQRLWASGENHTPDLERRIQLHLLRITKESN